MSSGLENQRQILNTWIKLEKCLDEFDTEVHREQKARPLSSSITNAKYSQSASKRPGSSAFNLMPSLPEPGGSPCSHLARPLTAFSQPKNRPVSGLSNLRPLTASNTINLNANSSLARTATFNKIINSLQLEHVIMMYEAKCKDNQVDYLQNQAKYFIDKIKLSTQGKNFNLSDQSLGLYSAQLLNSILKNNNHFLKLDFGKNNFGDEGVKFISEVLLFNRNIIHVDFSSNNLTEQGIKTICDAVGQNNTLISLNLKSFEGLNRNKVGAKGSVHLKKLLGRTKTLMYLHLSATQIGLIGLKNICEGLKANQSLLMLDVSNNSFGPNISRYFAGALSSSNLEELNLANNKLGDQGLLSLAPLFNRMNANQKLTLSGNKISCVGLAKLCESLTDNSTIQELYLDHNNLAGSGISCLNNFLWENASLQTLSMVRCEIDEGFGEAVKGGLARNTNMTHLILADNSLYDTGCQTLSEALWTNNKLICLDIRDNRIREKGGIAVGNLLKRNRTLQDINLSGNTITDNSAAVIVEALLHNKVFKRLKLKLNPVGYKYLSEIEHLLESNQNTLKKTFKPEIELKIKQLQIFEEKRDSVLEELENKKRELDKRKKEFKAAFELYEKAKADELAVTQGVEKELDQCMKRFNKMEEESHHLARDFTETKQQNKILLDLKEKEIEVANREIEELRVMNKVKRDEAELKEKSSKLKIEELKWAIQKEKDIQETELRRLQKLEDQYQEELKQRQPKTQAELGGQVSLFLKNKKNLEGDNEHSKEENKKKEEVSQPAKPGLARQGTIRQGPKPAKPDLAKPGIKPQRTIKESKPEGESKPSVKPGTANAKPKPNDKTIKPPSEKPKGTATGSAKPISSKPVNPIKQAPKLQKQEVKIAESLNVDPTNPVKQNDMQTVENSNPSNTPPVQPVLPTTSN